MLILYNAAAPWQGYIVTQVAANINQMDVGLKLDVKALSLYRIRQFLAHPDGVSLKGCSYIYAPAGQAGEYAPLAANPYRGCGHGCAYCYVPLVLKMKRPEFDAGAVPRENFVWKLANDARHYQAAGITEQVMLSFTSDPYHSGDKDKI